MGGEHQSTLLIAVRKGCHFCEESMPFYRRLVALRDQHQTDTQLVAVFPDSEGEAHGVLKDARLDSIGLAFGVPLSRINVTGTPTLLLVDKRGVVSRAWIGELTPDGEGEVIKALKPRGPLRNGRAFLCCFEPGATALSAQELLNAQEVLKGEGNV